jgi:hypothetical protein
MHAQGLSVLLRRAMLMALAAPAIACGGVVDNGDAGSDSGLPGCTAQETDAGVAASCGGKNMQLSGDISKCDVVDDAGMVPMSSCQAICGTQFSFCNFDQATNILSCEAPKSLTRSAHRARVDEVRHAREVGALARAFGVVPPKAVVAPARVRPLVEIALENAVEGCVRETFGALVAQWQGEHARDFRVRAAMKRIARDEARHAALGWRIHDWVIARLSREDRARVDAAMARATGELETSARVEPDSLVARTLGLPNAAQAIALVAAMRAEVWSARAA